MAREYLMKVGRWSTAGVLGLVVSLLFGAAGFAATDTPPGDDLFSAQLASGEFAPALAQAKQLPPAARDARLGALAKAQSAAGEQSASLATIGSMSTDLARGQALGEASPAPVQGARGGGGQADFTSLIDLITTTVAPTTWDEVGGPGAIQPYRNGVYVDSLGVIRPVVEKDADRLSRLRQSVTHAAASGQVRDASPLRKISLPRLEREIQLRLAAGRPLDDEMQVLAGLQRIRYVFIYPDANDIVLAGPAGDWTIDRENRIVSADTGRPVVQLDDLIVILRHIYSSRDGEFGCSITPTEEGLAKAQAYLEASSKKPLQPGQKGKWLAEVRSRLGRQNVEVFGIDPRSRVANAIVEADYRMKLVGIGLEEGTREVPSYLSMLKPGKARALDVLRWWFTINYDALATSNDRDVFEIRGQGVKVLSENELLTATGQQVHTGESDPLNAEFAHRFTKHFEALAKKYPVYADLQNIFDLALTASLIRAEGLADRVGWHMLTFRDPNKYAVAQGLAPKQVDTVANHRVANSKDILAVVSGGVTVNCRSLVRPEAIAADGKGGLGSEQKRSSPESISATAWWWD